MSLNAAESQHLLPHPPSSQETHYDTFEESNVVSTGEGQSQLQVVLEIPDSGQDNANQTPNEPEHNSQQSQRRSFRLCRVISSCLSSYKPLKYLAIAFGFWTGLGRWILCLIIPITIAILPLEMLNTKSYYCRVCIFNKPYNYTCTEEQSSYIFLESEFVYFITLLTVVLSYLMMIYCIRNLSNYPKALRLPKAFQLAKTTKMFNIIIFVSLTMIISLMLTKTYVSSKGVFDDYENDYENNVQNPYQTLVINQISHIAWRLFTSIVIWQTVISCLVFGVVMKALQALVDDCFKRITTMQADCVEDYIQVHQELCCKVESTFAAYRKWFLVNTFACIILISCVVFETASSIFGRTMEDYYYACKEVLCFYNIYVGYFFVIHHYYYFSILFLYASLVCYYPWYSMAHLRRSFNVIIKNLNTKTDWSPQHPFKNRLHLNSFIQYAKNTKYCSFMKFTCSSKIPYISMLLAMCGLFFRLYNQLSPKNYNHNRVAMSASIIRNTSKLLT